MDKLGLSPNRPALDARHSQFLRSVSLDICYRFLGSIEPKKDDDLYAFLMGITDALTDAISRLVPLSCGLNLEENALYFSWQELLLLAAELRD